MPFTAATWKMYDVPLTRPVTVVEEPATASGTETQVSPSLLYSTTYPVTAEPLSERGALHDRSADPSPREATTSVGASGKPAGVTALEAEDQSPGCWYSFTAST